MICPTVIKPQTGSGSRAALRSTPSTARAGAPWVLALLTGLSLLLCAGCASSGGSGSNRSPDDPSGRGPGAAGSVLGFRVAVNPNGVIDRTGKGYYAILLNAQGTPIEVTDLDTFTDFIRFDGQNFDWYHRLSEVPAPGFTFAQIGPLAGQAQVSPDGRSFDILIDLADPNSYLNQYIVANTFTAHVVTTDTEGGAFLGRILDTLGQGPNIDANSLQTVRVRKGQGALEPLPQSYPFDAQGDTVVHSNLGAEFPYENFDIALFEVTAR